MDEILLQLITIRVNVKNNSQRNNHRSKKRKRG